MLLTATHALLADRALRSARWRPSPRATTATSLTPTPAPTATCAPRNAPLMPSPSSSRPRCRLGRTNRSRPRMGGFDHFRRGADEPRDARADDEGATSFSVDHEAAAGHHFLEVFLCCPRPGQVWSRRGGIPPFFALAAPMCGRWVEAAPTQALVAVVSRDRRLAARETRERKRGSEKEPLSGLCD